MSILLCERDGGGGFGFGVFPHRRPWHSCTPLVPPQVDGQAVPLHQRTEHPTAFGPTLPLTPGGPIDVSEDGPYCDLLPDPELDRGPDGGASSEAPPSPAPGDGEGAAPAPATGPPGVGLDYRLTLGGGGRYRGAPDPAFPGDYRALRVGGYLWPMDDGLDQGYCRDEGPAAHHAAVEAPECCWRRRPLPPALLYFDGRRARAHTSALMTAPPSPAPRPGTGHSAGEGPGAAARPPSEPLVFDATRCAMEFWVRPPSAPAAAAVAVPAPDVHYPLAGDTVDAGPGARHGVLLAAPATEPGPRGPALRLNGADQWVQLPPSATLLPPGLPGVTAAVWFRTTAGARTPDNALGARLLTLHASDQGAEFRTGLSLGLYGDGHSVMAQYLPEGGPLGTLSHGCGYADGQWHMAAVVYDGRRARLTLYYDGAPVQARRVGALAPLGSNFGALGGFCSSTAWQRDADDFAEFGLFKGALQDARLYHSALSAAQVRALSLRPRTMCVAELLGVGSCAQLSVTLHGGLATHAADWAYAEGAVLFAVQDAAGRRLQARTLQFPFDGQWHYVKWAVQSARRNAMAVWVDHRPVLLQYGLCEAPGAGLGAFHAALHVGASMRDPPARHFFRGHLRHLRLRGAAAAAGPEAPNARAASPEADAELAEVAFFALTDGFGAAAAEEQHGNGLRLYCTRWRHEPVSGGRPSSAAPTAALTHSRPPQAPHGQSNGPSM